MDSKGPVANTGNQKCDMGAGACGGAGQEAAVKARKALISASNRAFDMANELLTSSSDMLAYSDKIAKIAARLDDVAVIEFNERLKKRLPELYPQ